MEYLPFRIEHNPHTKETAIAARFPMDGSQVPDLEDSRRQMLLDLEADLLTKGLPADLAERRDRLQDLVGNLGSQIDAVKARIHALADVRDAMWQGGSIPSVEALERADQAIDLERTRLGNLAGHLDGAKARLSDLHGEIAQALKGAAREAIAKATEFTPVERKAIDGLLALFQGAKAQALIAACLRQRLQYDFAPGANGGGWLGQVDALSGRVAHQLVAGPAISSPAEDEGEEGGSDLVSDESAEADAAGVLV